jgi:3-methyladenine DNA glycosylase AlkD
MPRRMSRDTATRAKQGAASLEDQVQSVVTWLKRHSTKATRDGMARYGLPSDHALGVSMANMKVLGKQLGKNHELAAALWDTGIYEARMVTSFVDDPALVTSAQMDRWCRDFDNWGICDTVCFHLFDRAPYRWQKVARWSNSRQEFVKRAAFALLASIALHDKTAGTALFLDSLPLIERAAADQRNFVKKGVSWALRAVGRRNPELNAASITLARRLASSPDAGPRWVGKDALRELTSAAVIRQLAAEPRAARPGAASRRRQGPSA